MGLTSGFIRHVPVLNLLHYKQCLESNSLVQCIFTFRYDIEYPLGFGAFGNVLLLEILVQRAKIALVS